MTDQASIEPVDGSGRVGTVARQEFGSHQLERSGETASSAAAAQARAQVEAMYVMALRRPRDLAMVREALLTDCKRRRFAEEAEYKLPRGGKTITGPSVRFAEAAARALTNIHVRTNIIYDDEDRRVGEVTVIDLESNVPLSSGFTIDKTVERKKLYGGEEVVSERVNTAGETTYRIRAREADIQQKQESMVSRIRRNLILQLLPGDIKDEALERCKKTLREGDAADPRATAKKLADSFAQIGISVGQIQEYLGHPVDKVTPDEADELRGIFAALKDGETNWAQVMDNKSSRNGESDEQKSARQKLLKKLAEARVRDRAAYDQAVKGAGAEPGVAAATFSFEVLERIAANLDGESPGKQPEREPGSDDDEQPPLPDQEG